MNTEAKLLSPVPALAPLARSKNKKLKIYNFKNPDKFSKDHLKVLSSIHDAFCRQANINLNAALRMTTELSVANVQQLTYGDFIASMPEDLLVLALSMYPFNTQFTLGIEKHLVGAMIDRTLGGSGNSSLKDELTDVEIGIFKDIFKRILTHLPEGWQNMIPTDDVEIIGFEQNPGSVQIVSSQDIVALVTINISIGNYLGFMNICLPYAALEDIISRLTRESTYKHEKNNDMGQNHNIILGSLSSTKFPVKTVLARGNLSLDEVMNLAVNDVICLSTKPATEVEIWIGEKLKFFGSPGKISNKLSVAVTRENPEK